MKGARELSDDEVIILAHSFCGKYAVRNRALFILGCCTGARISELLSLNVGDVWQFGRPVDAVYFERRNTKGKKEGRSIPLLSDAQAAITELIHWLEVEGFSTLKTDPLFPSQKGGRLKRRQALQVIDDAKNSAQLTGKVTSHSCRKTFAHRVFRNAGNLYTVKEALGHRSISTTEQYLTISEEELREAIPEFGISTRNSFDYYKKSPVFPNSSDNYLKKLEQRIQELEQQLNQKQTEISKIISFPEDRKTNRGA